MRTITHLALAATALLTLAGFDGLGGDEEQINTWTDGNQTLPVVGGDAEGNSVVVWASAGQDGAGWGVFGQHLDINALPVGPEFQVNETAGGHQDWPDVAVADDGSFVVSWRARGQIDSTHDVYARAFDPDGEPRTGELLVNQTLAGRQNLPAVAIGPDGEFALAWISGPDSLSGTVTLRAFDADGLPLGDEVSVSDPGGPAGSWPDVAITSAGRVVVVWSQPGPNGDADIHGNRFSACGSALSETVLLNGIDLGDETSPKLALGSDDRLALTWTTGSGSDVADPSVDVLATVLGPELSELVPAFYVNQRNPGALRHPTVDVGIDGEMAFAWWSYGVDGNTWGAAAAVFDAQGEPAGDEFTVNLYADGYQYMPSVDLRPDGSLLVTWAGSTADSPDQEILSRLFEPVPTDEDGDGVLDDVDLCLDSAPGEVVDLDGCSVADYCPCDDGWGNRGAYLRCVVHTSRDFRREGLISSWERRDLIVEAAHSDCGR
jgi:hypothetical protein